MERALQEFRIRGVKTNIPFLVNLVTHPKFVAGGFTTRFIDDTPELFEFKARQDRATKLFSYLAGVIVNGHPQVKNAPPQVRREPAPMPEGRPRVGRCRRARATSCWSWAPRLSAAGSKKRSGCWSPTPRFAMRINRCWPRGCGRTTCWPSPTPMPG